MANDRQNCQMVRVAGNRDTTPGSCEPGGAAEPHRVFLCAGWKGAHRRYKPRAQARGPGPLASLALAPGRSVSITLPDKLL